MLKVLEVFGTVLSGPAHSKMRKSPSGGRTSPERPNAPSKSGSCAAALILALALPVYAADNATLTEWSLPTVTSEPLNVLPASDSLVYVAERQVSRIGRLDLNNNQLVEWPLASGSYPHGMIQSNGKIVFGEQGGLAGAIASLNPDTNQLTEWPIASIQVPYPEHVAEGLGGIYFTESFGNRIGRINLTNNQLREWPLPAQTGFNLNGITVNTAGNEVWVVEILAKKIARLNVQTNLLSEWNLSHFNLLSHLKFYQGSIYFVDSAGNRLGRLNPATNILTEWSTPTPGAQIEDLEVTSVSSAQLKSVPSTRLTPLLSTNIFFSDSGGNKVSKLDISRARGTNFNLAPRVIAIAPVDSTVSPVTLNLQRLTSTLTPVSTNVQGTYANGITEFPVPTLNALLGGVSLSPRGRGSLFFVERMGNKIGLLGPNVGLIPNPVIEPNPVVLNSPRRVLPRVK